MEERFCRKMVVKRLKEIREEARLEALFAAYVLTQGLSVRGERLVKAIKRESEEGFYPLYLALLAYKEEAGLSRESLLPFLEALSGERERRSFGIVYTPAPMREFILQELWKEGEVGEDFCLLDPSCGCGGFFLTAAKLLHQRKGWEYEEILSRRIYGRQRRF
ncbi:MAG: N-6 DNA methylase [Blautia sp.]|nr:N-6 DNA methylase [Blautia sp.]